MYVQYTETRQTVVKVEDKLKMWHVWDQFSQEHGPSDECATVHSRWCTENNERELKKMEWTFGKGDVQHDVITFTTDVNNFWLKDVHLIIFTIQHLQRRYTHTLTSQSLSLSTYNATHCLHCVIRHVSGDNHFSDSGVVGSKFSISHWLCWSSLQTVWF